MTLNGVMAIVLPYFAEFGSYFVANSGTNKLLKVKLGENHFRAESNTLHDVQGH